MMTTTTSATFSDLDPATGETLAEIPNASREEVATAVARARAAQPAWRALELSERVRRIEQCAANLERAADEIAGWITREMGKVKKDAEREVRGQAKYVLDLAQEVVAAIAPETIAGKGETTRVVREPHGVVAAITPWNFPIAMPVSILVPALVTGNTVVFKPSEQVPLCGEHLWRAFAEALPTGVLELVQGDGSTGAALVEADVDMIGFVGSRDTGRAIMKSASASLKRLVLELGGKDPLVVFEDADLDAAAQCAVKHSLRNTGQVCCAVERVYVAASVAAEFEAKVVERARKWSHGSGFDEQARMGPLVSADQRTIVAEQVADAERRGARVLLGGRTPEGPGWFYPATVLADVDPSWPIARDETFGPVVCLSTFDGEETTALSLANDTPYGLGASVYTADPERGRRFADGLRAGQVGVNRYLGGATGTPWVGARQSGFGFLGGRDGHLQFTTPKTITIAEDS